MTFLLGLEAGVTHAAAGALDGSFGTGGKTTVSFGTDDSATGMALQPDGKIVVVGATPGAGGVNFDFAVTRLNANGSLDGSFGSGGKTTVDFGAGNDIAQAVAVQPDGKIVVAGYSFNPDADFAVVRLNPNGTPDASFGGGGKSYVGFGGDDEAEAIALQPDGKIVVAGSTSAGGTASNPWDFAVARLTTKGVFDGSFGGGGKAVVDYGANDQAQAVALQPDGKILLAGNSDSGLAPAGAPHENFAVVRLTSGGTFDSSFPGGGKTTVDLGGNDGATSVALQPDGKILIAGNTTAGVGGSDFALVRMLPAGPLDDSFGFGGRATADISGSVDTAAAMALQPDGKIVVVGSREGADGKGDFGVVRLSQSGSFDGSFAGGGRTTVDFGGNDAAGAMALQPDGKIVVAGTLSGTVSSFAVARLLGDPATGGGPPSGKRDTTPPTIRRASLTNTIFAVNSKGLSEVPVKTTATRRAVKLGTSFVFTLSEPAQVTFAIEQPRAGRRVGRSCRKPTRRNSRGRRCTRYVKAGAFGHNAVAGKNTKTWSGKIGRHALKTGSYRATLTGKDGAGNTSKPTHINFKIVARSRRH